MAEAKQMLDIVESLFIPNNCQTDNRNLQGVVPRRADISIRCHNNGLVRTLDPNFVEAHTVFLWAAAREAY
jgi:hypothetical protein